MSSSPRRDEEDGYYVNMVPSSRRRWSTGLCFSRKWVAGNLIGFVRDTNQIILITEFLENCLMGLNIKQFNKLYPRHFNWIIFITVEGKRLFLAVVNLRRISFKLLFLPGTFPFSKPSFFLLSIGMLPETKDPVGAVWEELIVAAPPAETNGTGHASNGTGPAQPPPMGSSSLPAPLDAVPSSATTATQQQQQQLTTSTSVVTLAGLTPSAAISALRRTSLGPSTKSTKERKLKNS